MGVFLVSPDRIKDKQALLDAAESHHLIHVLRKKIGDPLTLVTGKGSYFEGKISDTSPTVRVAITAVKENQELTSPYLLLCPALLKNPKMDWLIEKATELGVRAVLPFFAQRTVVQVSESEESKKIKRWEKIAVAALKQSGRSVLPQIGPILNFKALIAKYRSVDAFKLLFTPDASDAVSPHEIQRLIAQKGDVSSWIALIGPEGGFTEEEIEMARSAGFLPSSLGSFTLRAETAGLAVLSILNYLKESLA